MRLITYRSDGGVRHGRLGADDERSAVDLGEGDLLELLQAGPASLRAAAVASGPQVDLDEVTLLAPLRRPPKLLAVAANYADHIAEGGGSPVDKARIVPKLFLKPPTTISGPDQPLVLPAVSSTVDWEVELAAIIGERCRDVPVDEALGKVAGYTVMNDVSARTVDYGFPRDTDAGSTFFDWLQGKWCDGFAPLGPALVTADDVADPQALRLGLRVGGTTHQDGATGDMIFSVAEIIAFASTLMTLEPGDVIATGTPAGVGSASGSFLQPEDVMEAWVDGLGVLRTPVEARRG